MDAHDRHHDPALARVIRFACGAGALFVALLPALLR
jgi:hypothetical protein